MQNVFIEKPYHFVPPFKSAWLQNLVIGVGIPRRVLKKREGVIKHECRNLHLLKESLDAGHGVMLTPNHPRTADPALMSFVAQQTPCNFFTMASWHLFNQGFITKFIVRAMGAESG